MFRKFLDYIIPSILSMLVTSLYVIVDGIFVGRTIGPMALAAMSVIWPVVIVVFSLSLIFAVGGGALVSKNLGAKDINSAINLFRQTFSFLLLLSVFVCFIIVFFADEILMLLSTTGTLSSLSAEYLRYYGLFIIPNMIGVALGGFVRNDGSVNLVLASSVVGAITNIFLDYVFIYYFKWGMMGVAVASGISQLIALLVLLWHFFTVRGVLSFGFVRIKFKTILNFVSIGIPSFFTEMTLGVIIFCYNLMLIRTYGDGAVTVFSVMNYISANMYMIFMGLSFGVQPLISYNFGAKNIRNMLVFYRYAIISSLVLTFVYGLTCILFGHSIINIFVDDEAIINEVYYGLNLYNFAYIFLGVNLIKTIYYQAIEKTKISNMICLFRSLIFLPLSLYFMNKFFGINGVWAALFISELLSFSIISIFNSTKKVTLSLKS